MILEDESKKYSHADASLEFTKNKLEELNKEKRKLRTEAREKELRKALIKKLREDYMDSMDKKRKEKAQEYIDELKAGKNLDAEKVESILDRLPFDEGGEAKLPNEGLEALKKVAPEVVERMGYQEGGEMDDQMSMLMKKEQELPMESDEEMEDNYMDFILDEALTEEEEDMLMSKLQQDEQLSMLFDKVVEVASEFAGSGPVEGPGSGVSDSIPARLSDGEFVFTAKAVEEIGADELMRMMKDAEMRADERQGMANGGEMDEDTVVVKGDDEPARQEIRVVKETVDSAGRMVEDEDEISKNIKSNMMLDPNQQHVRS